ncbi:MAG: hypothetical protein WBW84_01965 [Acidobacteriaceae bacterium]
MSASAAFSSVEKLLKNCAPGYAIRLATHSRVVSFGTRVFRDLPKFDNIEFGHIRKMVRFLGISADCAAKHLPQVFKPERKSLPMAAAASDAVKKKR